MPKASPTIIAKKKRLIRHLKDSGLVTVDEFAVLIKTGMSVVAGWWNGGPVGVSMTRLEAADELVRQKGPRTDKLRLRSEETPPAVVDARPPLTTFSDLLDAKIEGGLTAALEGWDLDKRIAKIVDERLSVVLGLGGS